MLMLSYNPSLLSAQNNPKIVFIQSENANSIFMHAGWQLALTVLRLAQQTEACRRNKANLRLAPSPLRLAPRGQYHTCFFILGFQGSSLPLKYSECCYS
jgi:hypothetical protein